MTTKQIIFRIAIIILIIETIITLILETISIEMNWLSKVFIGSISLTILVSPIIYKLVIKPFISMKDEAQKRVYYLAYYDEITSLPNRTKLLDWLDHSIQTATPKTSFAIILLDLSRFIPINDTFGHTMVDNLIASITNKFKKEVNVDLIARLDTCKFAFVVEHCTSEEEVYLISNNILKIINKPITCYDVHSFNIEGSIGISRFPKDSTNKEDLLKYAHTAIRHTDTKNQICFYTKSLTEMTQKHFMLEKDLRKAIENNEFFLLYQPKICTKSDKLIGVEALIRWNHPTKGIVSPDDFIPLAEETGLIIPIGEWVLYEALKQQEKWQEEGKELILMSINLSAKQLELEQIESIIRILNLTQIPKKFIDFEITETYLMNDAANTQILLEKLHTLGVSLSIDDFGTGYSSLAYLKRFKVNILKIDRSLIQDIENDKNDFAITKAIVTMAHALDMKVVAEGVETLKQTQMLKTIECDCIQGFYFSKPIEADLVYN